MKKILLFSLFAITVACKKSAIINGSLVNFTDSIIKVNGIDLPVQKRDSVSYFSYEAMEIPAGGRYLNIGCNFNINVFARRGDIIRLLINCKTGAVIFSGDEKRQNEKIDSKSKVI